MSMILSVHNVKVSVMSFAQSKNAWLTQSFHLTNWKTCCTHNQAVQAIHFWKAHQLRSVRQDTTRTVCLRALDETTVLITQGWTMKFLPLKYRETQSDWYAKRGISWHVSVVARKMKGLFESQSFCPHSREYITRQLSCSAHH